MGSKLDQTFFIPIARVLSRFLGYGVHWWHTLLRLAVDLGHVGGHLRPGNLGHLKGKGILGGINCHFYLLLLPHFLALILQVRLVGSKLTSAGRSGPEMNFLAFQSICQAVLGLQLLHHLVLLGQRQVLGVTNEDMPVVGKLAHILHRDIAVVHHLDDPSDAVIRRSEAELEHLH